MNVDHLIDRARAVYGSAWQPTITAIAPGRLELLGNHVDYNGGPVLAAAIERVVVAVSSIDGDAGTIQIHAPDIDPAPVRIDIDDPAFDPQGESASPEHYAAGIVAALREREHEMLAGLRIAVSGDVPLGFGMSSSAALCVALTMTLSEKELTPDEVVRIARRAEHLTGAPVGAMDQAASVSGGVILFDGATQSVTPMQPSLEELVFVVASSGVSHALARSSYPTRVAETERALALLNEHAGLHLDHLAALDSETWSGILADDPAWLNATLRDRIEHIVRETSRVREGVKAVEAEDWFAFGALMTASGDSSDELYAISHPRVEELVDTLLAMDGVLGARMMGGGEGGPALALVRRKAVDAIRGALAPYFDRHGLDRDDALQVCGFGPAARVERTTR